MDSLECGKKICDSFKDTDKIDTKLKNYYDKKFSEIYGIEIESQHGDGNRELSMKGISLEYFPNTDKIIING